MKFSESGSPSEAPVTKVILCICTLGNLEPSFVKHLIDTCLGGVFENYCIIEKSLITYARNKAIGLAYEYSPDFTHILFVDDDMVNFNAESVRKLIDADKDVVSGLMTLRSPPYTIVSNFETEEGLLDDIRKGNLLKANFTGSAFTLIKKEVLDATKEATEEGDIWFTNDREWRPKAEDELSNLLHDLAEDDNGDYNGMIMNIINYAKQAHIGTNLTGEDIAFCKKIQKFGFEVWVHCGVPVGHLSQEIANVQKTIDHNFGIVTA